MLQDAWLLLKDFSFRRNLPEDYYNTLPERMIRHIESRRPLEHVDGRVHPHYANRKQERYNENQALPKEFNTRAAKKYKFTLEDIMMFMANDVVSQHPELKQVMNMQLPASDSRLPNRDPSMHFDAFQTSRPKATEHGLQHLVTPHFTINPRSKKLQLKTVGSGAMADRSRQSIHAKPTTSPIVNDNHDNAKIHESLPQRFDFMERETPPGQAVETASPIQPDEPDDKYSHLSPPFAARMRELDAQRQSNSNDNVETGEPMDIALRLLKRDLSEMTDYEIDRARFANDNQELQNEERTRAMDRMAEYARMNHPPAYALEEMFGEQVADAHDEIGDQDHSDYFGDSIDPNEMHQYILQNAGEEAAQNYINMYRMYRSQYGGNRASMSQLDAQGMKDNNDLMDFATNRQNLTQDLETMMPTDSSVFDAFPYPEGTEFINHLSPPFTSTPQNESNFQMKYASEPMDIAMRLLKEVVI